MANTNGQLSAAQRRTLEALAVDGALIMSNTSADWPVRLGPYVLTMVRWATMQSLAKAGHIAPTEWPGVYHITDAGRAALAEADGTKESETA
jgi:hypothetical protein